MKIREFFPEYDVTPIEGFTVFHPKLASLCGSIYAAILFCRLMHWHGKQMDKDGWIHKSIPEMEEETALCRKSQCVAIKKLKDRRLLETEYFRSTHRRCFRLNVEEFKRLVVEYFELALLLSGNEHNSNGAVPKGGALLYQSSEHSSNGAVPKGGALPYRGSGTALMEQSVIQRDYKETIDKETTTTDVLLLPTSLSLGETIDSLDSSSDKETSVAASPQGLTPSGGDLDTGSYDRPADSLSESGAGPAPGCAAAEATVLPNRLVPSESTIDSSVSGIELGAANVDTPPISSQPPVAEPSVQDSPRFSDEHEAKLSEIVRDFEVIEENVPVLRQRWADEAGGYGPMWVLVACDRSKSAASLNLGAYFAKVLRLGRAFNQESLRQHKNWSESERAKERELGRVEQRERFEQWVSRVYAARAVELAPLSQAEIRESLLSYAVIMRFVSYENEKGAFRRFLEDKFPDPPQDREDQEAESNRRNPEAISSEAEESELAA